MAEEMSSWWYDPSEGMVLGSSILISLDGDPVNLQQIPKVELRDYDTNELVDTFDAVKSAINPTGVYDYLYTVAPDAPAVHVYTSYKYRAVALGVDDRFFRIVIETIPGNNEIRVSHFWEDFRIEANGHVVDMALAISLYNGV